MVRKQPFQAEPVTKPTPLRSKALATRSSGQALKDDRRERSEAPTLPPPRAVKSVRVSKPPEVAEASEEGRISGTRVRKPARPLTSAATVDEVVADLSKDPRRERDDDDDDDE